MVDVGAHRAQRVVGLEGWLGHRLKELLMEAVHLCLVPEIMETFLTMEKLMTLPFGERHFLRVRYRL